MCAVKSRLQPVCSSPKAELFDGTWKLPDVEIIK